MSGLRLDVVANHVAQELSDCGDLGLTKKQCHALAKLLDQALVAAAPPAPPPVVVALNMWRQRHAAE